MFVGYTLLITNYSHNTRLPHKQQQKDHKMEKLFEKAHEFCADKGLILVGALVILLIGWNIARLAKSITYKRMLKNKKIDDSVAKFSSNIVYILFLVFTLIAFLNQLNVATASVIAVLGAAGLAVAFALQGSLSNLASGVLLIMLKPFKAGDYVECAGVQGFVEEVDMLTTQIRTTDNKRVIIPNAQLTSNNMINYSANKTRRVDLVFGVSYDADIDHVKRVIAEELDSDERILKDPAHYIGLVELADSSVNFVVRPWCTVANYWDVFFDTQERVKKRLDKEGISIPFPQRDIHMITK